MTHDPNARWLLRDTRQDNRDLRLFMFPYAGAGASIYREWQAEAPPQVQVLRVQPPGREQRAAEPALNSVDAMAHGFLGAALPMMDRPFAFFGHSLGSMVAFRAAAILRQRPGVLRPALLMVSGARPPHLPDPDPIHTLPDDRFRLALKRRGGTPDEILNDPGVFSFFAPTLRADLCAAENWHDPDPAVPDLPMGVFVGHGDSIAKSGGANDWLRYARGAPEYRVFDGGHFFLHSQAEALRRAVFGLVLRHWKHLATPSPEL